MAGRRKGKLGLDPIDERVGSRIKARRAELGLSQTALGERLGVTFQQVQKYEKGRNRVGASRLADISRFLKVDPEYFFERSSSVVNDKNMENINAFIASKDGKDLMRALMKIKNKDVSRQITILVERLADKYSGR